MAEFLDINRMLANTYQPKQKHLFVLEMDGVDSFVVSAVTKPSITQETVQLDYINVKRYITGKRTYSPITITVHDPIAPSAAQKVNEWLNLHVNYATGRAGYSSVIKKNFSLKSLGPDGTVVEKWNIIGALITETNFGSLEYSSSELVDVVFTVQPDECRLEF